MCVYVPRASQEKLSTLMADYVNGHKPDAAERLRNLSKKELAWLLVGQDDLSCNTAEGRERNLFFIWATGVLAA